jgi:hypothetical protein
MARARRLGKLGLVPWGSKRESLPQSMHLADASSRLPSPACGWLQAKCVYHFKAAMGLLQQHAVCDAQYDFVSQWDYQRGARVWLPAAPYVPLLSWPHNFCDCVDGVDALADRRQESVAEAPVSFGEPASAQQRGPERNVATQLSTELRAAFPLPSAPADSVISTTTDAGVGNAKRPNADADVENRQVKKVRT